MRSVRSGESPGLVTWVKADGAWMDGACRDPQYGSGSDDVGPEEMRLMLRSACPSEYGACVGDASCSAELSVGLVSDAAMLADAASELFESLTECYALSGGRRLQQMGCMSLSDADSCAMGGCEWDGVSCRPDCSFIPGDPSTCGSGCIYTARVDGCVDCVAGKYATVVGSATVTDCIDAWLVGTPRRLATTMLLTASNAWRGSTWIQLAALKCVTASSALLGSTLT